MPVISGGMLVALGVGLALAAGGNYETVSGVYRLKKGKREKLYRELAKYHCQSMALGEGMTNVMSSPSPFAGSINTWATLMSLANGFDIIIATKDCDALLSGKQLSSFSMYGIPVARSAISTSKKDWAVILGPTTFAETTTPGTSTPGTPGTTIPVVQVPPGAIPPPPGTTPGSVPWTTPAIITQPGGVTIPENGIPASPDVLDANMPQSERMLTYQLLVSAGTLGGATPDALDLASRGMQLKEYPIAMQYCIARARYLRKQVAVPPPKPPSPYPPGTTTPGTTTPGTTPQKASFVIREGHIPWKVAQHYTGDANRWKELPSVNPGMVTKTVNGVTQLVPWYGGLTVYLPASWDASRGEPPALGSPPPKTTGATGTGQGTGGNIGEDGYTGPVDYEYDEDYGKGGLWA